MSAPGWPPGPEQAWQPRPYHQLLRGPRHRWWRPLLSLLVLVGLLVVWALVSGVGLVAAVVATGHPAADALSGDVPLDGSVMAEPAVMLLNNLVLAALVPVSVLAVWAGHGWRPRWVSSVVGGVRWRWLVECTGLALVVCVVSTLVLFVLDGWPSGQGSQVVALLAVVLVTTPLQAAGEEWFFRGWMTQTIGSVLARPVVGAVVTALVSAALFAVAHGSQNVWLWLDRFAFGLLASYLVWRTGGLEAATAVHAVNNLVVFVPVIATGTLQESLLVSEVPVWMVAADVVTMVVMGAVVVWWARRRGVQRLHLPPPPPPPPSGPAGWPAPAGSALPGQAGLGPAHGLG